ncbi:MAG: NAD(P)-binding protein [Rubrivivax sp.]|nr:NAD(P)-binding protein [Rubrivivax sp.]
MPSDALLDVAIVGGGLAGLIHLHYARRAGLRAHLFERASGVGGLWRELPAWQDIQIRPLDWTVGDLPVAGPMQPQILANIEQWVARFGLADGISLGCPVRQARHAGGVWVLESPLGEVRARHLVAATGAHNVPVIPAVQRQGAQGGEPPASARGRDLRASAQVGELPASVQGHELPASAQVRELHSSALREPAELAGRDVVVVGGGASAFDLLELCLEHGARRIVWVYRSLRWFTPTRKPKAVAGSVRPLARQQAEGVPIEQQTAAVDADLRGRYRAFGIEALLPGRPVDLRHDQVFPGRAGMLAGLARIERCPGTVRGVEGHEVLLSDGRRLAADLLLWGTGYRMDLGWLEDPRLAAIDSTAALAARCGCVMRSLDAPDLYLPGVLLDGFGATSWNYAIIARTVMSHVRGQARLDLEPTAHRLNHLDVVAHLAARDPASFGGADARAWCREAGLGTPDDRPYALP